MQATFSVGSPPPTTPLRVVQWATGNIGTRALQHVIRDPQMQLVGLHVHSPDKVGTDAGVLAGSTPVGVAATGTIEEVLALGADCVLYMPRQPDIDDLCRILAGGTNIVTTVGLFHHPPSMNPEVRARVEAACAEGASSIHATGSSPGFISEAVPLVLASIQRRVDLITIDEYADLSRRDSPGLLFDVMGFGVAPEAFDPRRFGHGVHSFGPSLRQLADAIGLPLDSVESGGELGLATRDITIAAGTLAAGTVAAQRMIVTGHHDGREIVRFRATWFCSHDLDQDWNLLDTGWRVSVQGDAPLEVELRFPITLEQMADTTPGYTANRAVNAVPYVCAARPGILTTVDLPYVLPSLR